MVYFTLENALTLSFFEEGGIFQTSSMSNKQDSVPQPVPYSVRHNLHIFDYNNPDDEAYEVVNVRVIWAEHCMMMQKFMLRISDEIFTKGALFGDFLDYMKTRYGIQDDTWWLERYPYNPVLAKSSAGLTFAALNITNGSTITLSHFATNGFVRGLAVSYGGPGMDKL